MKPESLNRLRQIATDRNISTDTICTESLVLLCREALATIELATAENAALQYRLRHKTSEVVDVLRERNEFDAEIAKLRAENAKLLQRLRDTLGGPVKEFDLLLASERLTSATNRKLETENAQLKAHIQLIVDDSTAAAWWIKDAKALLQLPPIERV